MVGSIKIDVDEHGISVSTDLEEVSSYDKAQLMHALVQSLCMSTAEVKAASTLYELGMCNPVTESDGVRWSIPGSVLDHLKNLHKEYDT